jgi:hypothetical protein
LHQYNAPHEQKLEDSLMVNDYPNPPLLLVTNNPLLYATVETTQIVKRHKKAGIIV